MRDPKAIREKIEGLRRQIADFRTNMFSLSYKRELDDLEEIFSYVDELESGERK